MWKTLLFYFKALMEVNEKIHVPALLSPKTWLPDAFDRLDGLQIWSKRLGKIRNFLHPPGVGW
jgi:hypothetical protein